MADITDKVNKILFELYSQYFEATIIKPTANEFDEYALIQINSQLNNYDEEFQDLTKELIKEWFMLNIDQYEINYEHIPLPKKYLPIYAKEL